MIKPYVVLKHLIDKHQDAFSSSWQRTVERRVANWKIENGVGQDFFADPSAR
jgi:hypothetical protein